MSVKITPPQARVPLGFVEIEGQRYPVPGDPEWIRFLTLQLAQAFTQTNVLTVTDGTTSGDVSTLMLPGGTLTIVDGVATYTPTGGGGGSLTITELDGAPSVAATSLVFPNGTLSVVGTVATFTPAAGTQTDQKGASWDAGGNAGLLNVTAANIVRPRAKIAGTILSAYCCANTVGSATIEVWKSSTGPATVANKISALNPITLAAQQESTDTTLTGWATAVAVGDRFGFKLLTATGISWIEGILTIG